MENENEKKKGQKNIKRDLSAERWREDLESAIEGACCYFYYCYNGTYPGCKILLHLKKNTGNLVKAEGRIIKTIGGFSTRRGYTVFLSSAQKRHGRAGI